MTYGIPQRCALIVLAARGGEAPNTALSLDRAGRERLERDGLITVAKRPKPMRLRLTDKGWRAFEDELVAEPPPRSGSAGPALYALLHALGALITREGREPRMLLRGEDAPAKATAPAPGGGREPPGNPGSGAGNGDLAAAIRSAYGGLARRPRAWVELSDLRAALGAIPREEVDGALVNLLDSRAIELGPHEDRSSLTNAQRAAALKVGRSEMHIISMDD